MPRVSSKSLVASRSTRLLGPWWEVDTVSATWRRAGLVTVKLVHTAAFFSIGSCLVYLAYSGLTRRSDRRAAIAGAVVTGEALVYAANGFRCPLTDVAERLGA